MSSTHTPVIQTDTFVFPSDKVPNAVLSMDYPELSATPSPEELNLCFLMLDALLLRQPFEHWEP